MKTENINKMIRTEHINFIMMDIEGGELELAYKIDYAKIDHLLMEIHPHVIGSLESTKIIAHLFNEGFEIDFNLSRLAVLLFNKQGKSRSL